MSKCLMTTVVVLGAACLAGCGEAPPQMYEVSGTVTLNGQPLEKVRVEFIPEGSGPHSAGVTDANGRFELMTIDGKSKGAVAGLHRVTISDISIVTQFVGRREDIDVTAGQKPRISVKYGNMTTTPLEANITEKTDDLTFELEPFEG